MNMSSKPPPSRPELLRTLCFHVALVSMTYSSPSYAHAIRQAFVGALASNALGRDSVQIRMNAVISRRSLTPNDQAIRVDVPQLHSLHPSTDYEQCNRAPN